MVRCDPAMGKYMSCVLLYRGDISPTDINDSIRNIKRAREVNFVDWSPVGFKVGLNNMPPSFVPGGDIAPTSRALCAISNNTNIRQAWCRLVRKYDQLFQRRAFVYHFVGEGLEECILSDASNNICELIHDYKEVESTSSTADD